MFCKKKKLFLTLLLTKELTKSLLDQKGFSYSYEKNRKNLVERSVLLVTEVSELADANKKRLGEIEEMDEVADIVIRMVGYLLMFDNISKRVEEQFEILSNGEKCEYTPDFSYLDNDDYYNKKLVLINDIQNQVFQLNTVLESYYNYKSNKDSKLIDSIINCIINVLMMCEFYMDYFLYGVELQIAINEKIKKNYLRPIGYGYNKE